MRGSRNFHERGSNENGNFWPQTRGGPTPKKSRNYLFLGKIFKFQGGSGPPVPPSGSAHAVDVDEEARCQQIVFAFQKGTLGVRWENAKPNFSKVLTTKKVDIFDDTRMRQFVSFNSIVHSVHLFQILFVQT